MFDFDTFYVLWYTRAKHFATFYLKDEEDAEDVVQDVFLKLYERRPLFEETHSEIGYLFTALKHACLSVLRQRLHTLQHTSVETLTDRQELRLYENALAQTFIEFQDETHLQQRIEPAINQLPPRCKEIFILRKFHHLSQKEVAQTLAISTHSVEPQMGIAYAKLRKTLQNIRPLLVLLGL